MSFSFVEYRPYLFSVAYHILGEIPEAEDIVQDSLEVWLRRPSDEVRNVKSYLTRVVANKAIDRLKERQKQQANYPGYWLPEPFVTSEEEIRGAASPDLLSYAMMHLLEQLNPAERAVFILREAYDYPYNDLAELLDLSPANCRQLLSRARKKIRPVEALPVVAGEDHQEVLEAFLRARKEDNPDALARLLKEDVILYSDGGGKRVAAMVPLVGADTVLKFLVGVARKTPSHAITPRGVQINGQPGILLSLNGQPDTLIALETEGAGIRRLFLVRNPDKIFSL